MLKALMGKADNIHYQRVISAEIWKLQKRIGRGNMVADGNLDLYKQWRKSETEQIKVKLILNCLL